MSRPASRQSRQQRHFSANRVQDLGIIGPAASVGDTAVAEHEGKRWLLRCVAVDAHGAHWEIEEPWSTVAVDRATKAADVVVIVNTSVARLGR